MHALVFPILFYNCICCFFVGKQFAQDPRTAAQSWVQKQIAPGSLMESSAGSPHWKNLPGFNAAEVDAGKPNWTNVESNDVIDLRMPHASGRPELFAKIFVNDSWMREHAEQYEAKADEQLFTVDALEKRQPQFITVYSSDYQVRSPLVRKYYSDLLAQKFSYDIVFDGESKEQPGWIYPRDIDFLRGRITILSRRREILHPEAPGK